MVFVSKIARCLIELRAVKDFVQDNCKVSD